MVEDNNFPVVGGEWSYFVQRNSVWPSGAG